MEDPSELHRGVILGIAPGVAVAPASADEIAAVLRFANEHGLSVVPAGGFTQQQVGNLPSRIDVLLYTSRLTDVDHYDPGDLTVGIGAGCTVAQLSAMVGANGLLFAGDAALPERSTVGGLLATAMPGPLRHGYGGLRDYCIGIRFVTGDGRKAKGGGRVVKNVAGYDLMKLLIGSQGTLAIITAPVSSCFRHRGKPGLLPQSLVLPPRQLIFAIVCCARRCRQFAWSWSRPVRVRFCRMGKSRLRGRFMFVPREAMLCWLAIAPNWGRPSRMRWKAERMGRVASTGGFFPYRSRSVPAWPAVFIGGAAKRNSAGAGPSGNCWRIKWPRTCHNREGGGGSSAGRPVADEGRGSYARELHQCRLRAA